jgi:transposase InsO family protein
MTLAGATQEEAARSIGLARTTVGRWRADWSDSRLAIRPRGRRAKRADRDQRSDLLHVLEHEGTGVGIPELKSRFPKIARRELESIRSRRASVLRRKRAESLFTLSWTRAGSVWATDFTQCPTPIDDDFRKLMLVRDLASGAQLTSLPCTGESAAEVRLVLEDLFAEHGAPLVIKEDNGPGFIAQATRELLAEHGVLVLYSPPYSPSYNGACEAGNGSIKCRATRIAAHAGRAGHWTADDVERA